jgi:hypothetical protein
MLQAKDKAHDYYEKVRKALPDICKGCGVDADELEKFLVKLLQSSVLVSFSVATPTSGAAAVSTGIANGITTAQLPAAGLSSATGLTVSSTPTLTSTAPVAVASVAPVLAARVAVTTAAVAALMLAL